jgi:hypothetical protein
MKANSGLIGVYQMMLGAGGFGPLLQTETVRSLRLESFRKSDKVELHDAL